MNRLIIIGNGFDLAHGLPTSYRAFIDDFWKNFKEKCLTKDYMEMVCYNESYNGYFDYGQIDDFAGFLLNIKRYAENYKHHFDDESFICYRFEGQRRVVIFEFENTFFKLINKKNSQNWVDIENEYYTLLKEIVNKPNVARDIKKIELLKLNGEFEQVKNLLEQYLKEKIIDKYNFDEYNDSKGAFFEFYDIFFPELMLPDDDYKKIIFPNAFSKIDKEEIEHLIKINMLDVKLHFLSFNYTPTLNRYVNHLKYRSNIKVETNFIHGIVGNKKDNKINFGFGDEMDEHYKVIENIDDNEYLKYFKSFQYLQNPNYKNLLNFVESEKFEVYIMGASCGLSDRTLLNTIFENNNCRLIKVFYYKNGDYDNFTELIQNISRHFNKKALMRTKIFHKSDEQIMPQVQLPLKQKRPPFLKAV